MFSGHVVFGLCLTVSLGIGARDVVAAERRAADEALKSFIGRLKTAVEKEAGSSVTARPVFFDLNADKLTDFAVTFPPYSWGSGGCTYDVYVSAAAGRWRKVGDIFGRRLRAASTRTRGYRDLLSFAFVGPRSKGDLNAPHSIDEVYKLTKGRYRSAGLRHRTWRIRPLKTKYCVRDGAAIFGVPARREPSGAFDAETHWGEVLGKVEGRAWYLVRLFKVQAGYVHASSVKKAKAKSGC